MSRAYGSDPALVVAGGGNSSVKLGDHLLVKASGAAMASVTAGDFVDLDRRALRALLAQDLPEGRDEREAAFMEALMAARASPGQPRPSVESLLHHLVPGLFVVHLHATAVNQFACSRDGQRLVEEHLGTEVAWAPLVDPGFVLARVVQEKLRAFSSRAGHRPRALVLQNHGLVVSGESPEELDSHLRWLLSSLRDIAVAEGRRQGASRPRATARPPGLALTALAGEVRGLLGRLLGGEGGPPAEVSFDASEPVVGLLARPDGRDLALGGPLTPDQVVYCQSFPLWVEPPEGAAGEVLGRLAPAVATYASTYHVVPKVVLVRGLGMFTAGATAGQAEAARLVYLDAIKVMEGAEQLGGINFLDDDFRSFIERWEVEAYRRRRQA